MRANDHRHELDATAALSGSNRKAPGFAGGYLLASGVDIVTVSKRLGHAKPSVTLAIYAHMFTSDDSKAAAAINAALDR